MFINTNICLLFSSIKLWNYSPCNSIVCRWKTSAACCRTRGILTANSFNTYLLWCCGCVFTSFSLVKCLKSPGTWQNLKLAVGIKELFGFGWLFFCVVMVLFFIQWAFWVSKVRSQSASVNTALISDKSIVQFLYLCNFWYKMGQLWNCSWQNRNGGLTGGAWKWGIRSVIIESLKSLLALRQEWINQQICIILSQTNLTEIFQNNLTALLNRRILNVSVLIPKYILNVRHSHSWRCRLIAFPEENFLFL